MERGDGCWLVLTYRLNPSNDWAGVDAGSKFDPLVRSVGEEQSGERSQEVLGSRSDQCIDWLTCSH